MTFDRVNRQLSYRGGQRVKLATELQRGDTLYVVDEPTSDLHCADTDRLVAHLQMLVEAGNTVVAVELDMRVIAADDRVIGLGPGAGDAGGTVVAAGTREHVADKRIAVRFEHRTATHSTNSWS
ncbi:ABC transporter-like protein [Mycobacteroides abscessus subsp. bolletii]|nr:ABC transporter-like protein [Mycobacteroides abscessus subsp. bolletii]